MTRSGSSTTRCPEVTARRTPPPRALYVHVPFCARHCPYCSFPIALPRDRVDTDAFLAALERELAPLERPRLRTMFIGGGTPSRLGAAGLERLFALLVRSTDLTHVVEVSLEANPEDLTTELAVCLASSPVNRVSLGAQSFDPRSLRMLGRRHDARQITVAVDRLRHAGRFRVNVDLIFALPGQTPESAQRDVEAAVTLAPDHVSAYCLTYEEDTPLQRARDRGRMLPPPDAAALDMYRDIRSILRLSGYEQYEVSNFARFGSRCVHNLVYWKNDPYVGVGPGAVSFVGGTRRQNVSDTRTWIERLLTGADVVASSERLEGPAAVREAVMMGLRLRRGLRAARLRRRYGTAFESLDAESLQRLETVGMLSVAPDRIRLTERGIECADWVAAELL